MLIHEKLCLIPIYYFFLISLSFGALGRLCFVIMAFPGMQIVSFGDNLHERSKPIWVGGGEIRRTLSMFCLLNWPI